MSALLGISALGLTACGNSEKYIWKFEEVEMKVVSVDPPKRFNINFVDAEGNTYSAYSKRCSNSHKVKVGMVYTLPVTIGMRDDRTIVSRSIDPSACTIASDYYGEMKND